jgi:hypothetical protein
MSNDSVITEEMKSMLGMETNKVVFEVDKTMLRGIAEAIEDSNPRWLDLAAPAFILSAMVTGGGGKLPENLPMNRTVAGGGDWEFYLPVKVGDVITCTSKLADIYERQGKAGKLLFIVTETTVTNHRGDLAAKGNSTLINY